MAAAPTMPLEFQVPAAAWPTNPVPGSGSLPFSGRRILYTGPKAGTSLQRAQSLRALGAEVVHVRSGLTTSNTLAHQLYRVVNRIKRHPDFFLANRGLKRAARQADFDLVWVDKGLWLAPSTIARLRELLPGTPILSYSPDDMGNPSNQTPRYLESLALYDLHVTTKSYNVAELQELGAGEVLFVDNAFDPSVHRRLDLNAEEQERWGAEVGFVGAYEAERGEMLLRLAQAGLPVTVRGPEWNRNFKQTHPNLRIVDEWLDDASYPKAVNATKINLGFLRKCNRDLQTTRSVEIPACGGFLLAERTSEHQKLFREGRDAEFFADFDELVAKCRHYLANDDERRKVAERGHRRCILGGYSNEGRLGSIIEHALSLVPQRAARRAPRPTRSLAPIPLQAARA